ncbi:MAG: chemotaxis protein CheA [Limnochordia bacterium]|jgi:two-component system chemotaxis sensor kinase CheA
MNRELLATYLEEANEGFPILENQLLALERAPQDEELINGIFRLVHSLKGSAGLIGLSNLAEFLHHMEELLAKIRTRQVAVEPEIIDTLLTGLDLAKGLLVAIEAGEDPPLTGAHRDVMARLESFQGGGGSMVQQTKDYRVDITFDRGIFASGTDPLMLIKEVAELGQPLGVELLTHGVPTLDELDPHQCYLAWTLLLRTSVDEEQIRDVFIFVEEETQVQIQSLVEEVVAQQDDVAASLKTMGETIRVQTRKLDGLMNQLGQLVISQSRLRDILSKKPLDRGALEGALEEMEKAIRELQDGVLSTRMVPLETIFNRFPRIVRELAAEKGKEVDFQLLGSDTELDKTVVEKLSDPVKHMLRNAIDHGLETPEERRAQGKPPQGQITLQAYQREGGIILEVIDDGRGIDPQKIRTKALDLGLLDPHAELTDEEILNLLFLPGFSTAERITEISGRGVGMDVVKENINKLRGTIGIESKPGEGTIVRIRLPLTMAILDGMVVQLGEEKMVIPLSAIVEFIQPTEENLKRAGDNLTLLRLRGDYVPVAPLGKLFSIPTNAQRCEEGILILIKDGSRRLCLLVDGIIGEQQVVIKSLQDNYRQVEGLAGATILGDGSVAMIIDAASLIELATLGKDDRVAL